jgi:hypothetical protein
VTRYCTLTPFTLTDAEREAIGYFAGEHCRAGDDQASHITTLRGLLERTSAR